MGSLEAKIVVLGSQGVGKTSLVLRYAKNDFSPASTHSTIGASFLTKRVIDDDTDTTVRLQIWDTAGQERFRSISKLYYRGANAGVLCYDITDEQSFEEMGRWLVELKKNLGDDVVLHVVGTKRDLVEVNPGLRKVPFERCIAYVAEHLYPELSSPLTSTPPGTRGGLGSAQSPSSKRSSGFWGQDVGWDCCHEISARDGEGVDEVFRVITRKLVEQRNKRLQKEKADALVTNGVPGGGVYPDGRMDGGSFRVGMGDKRRSWMGFPTPVMGIGDGSADGEDAEIEGRRRRGRCC
ncbi:MAG: hypothetical protein M1829_004211 [Trizodia sp. TS-e1964]|nr:MAG: hypothetical protein M1829_004211 [Trizodia sp. TS-e1964]